MTHDDLLVRRISGLTVLTSDERRADRVRARCRARLVQRARQPRREYGSAMLAGLGLVYLSAIVLDVLRLR